MNNQLLANSPMSIARCLRQAERLRNHGKFTGYGFFDIEMSTLTAMAEISLTYIIVLATNS